jgi:hypothetical protein
MALRLPQLLTEISTRNFPGGKARKANNLTIIYELIVKKMCHPRCLRGLLQGWLYIY